jgi:Protein of unknown function (DUF2778)
MRYAAATVPVTPLNARAFGARDYRRTIVGGAVLGIGSMSAVVMMAGAVTVTAAWMVSGSLTRDPRLRSAAPFAIEIAAFPEAPRRLADPSDMFGSALAAANPVYAPDETHAAKLASSEPATLPPVATPAPPTRRTPELADDVPLPLSRPVVTAEIPVKTIIFHRPTVAAGPAVAPLPATRAANIASSHAREVAAEDETRSREKLADVQATRPEVVAEIPVKTIIYRRPTVEAAPVVTVVPAAPAPRIASRPVRHEATVRREAHPHEMVADADVTGAIPPSVAPSRALSLPSGARAVHKPAPRLAYNNPETVPARDSHTAIYDILAHTVYLPDGERLEAHSGLGRMLDDPHYASVKARGPTPPNTYDLTLRRGLFHGVQALRLNPVTGSRMYGRDGILAHTYMLGPSGQSFGCVSFKNYSEFLRAFQRGEVDRMVVVPHLASPPPYVARAEREDHERFASSNW